MIDREYAKMCVGAGWHSLVDEAYDLCEAHEIEITQIKEKFGGLRIYMQPLMDKELCDLIDPKIAGIEMRSYTMCESCGQPAEPSSKGYWVKTICKSCEEINDVLAKKGK